MTPWIDPKDGVPESLVKYVEPSEIMTYNISIENTGVGGSVYIEDTYTISIGGVQDGWRANIVEGFDEVLLPGEIEQRTYASKKNTGIPLPEKTWNKILKIAEEFGVIDPDKADSIISQVH